MRVNDCSAVRFFLLFSLQTDKARIQAAGALSSVWLACVSKRCLELMMGLGPMTSSLSGRQYNHSNALHCLCFCRVFLLFTATCSGFLPDNFSAFLIACSFLARRAVVPKPQLRGFNVCSRVTGHARESMCEIMGFLPCLRRKITDITIDNGQNTQNSRPGKQTEIEENKKILYLSNKYQVKPAS